MQVEALIGQIDFPSSVWDGLLLAVVAADIIEWTSFYDTAVQATNSTQTSTTLLNMGRPIKPVFMELQHALPEPPALAASYHSYPTNCQFFFLLR